MPTYINRTAQNDYIREWVIKPGEMNNFAMGYPMSSTITHSLAVPNINFGNSLNFFVSSENPQGGDLAWRCSYGSGSSYQVKTISSNLNSDIHIGVKVNGDYKETITPSFGETFRTKLHCGTPISTLNINYLHDNNYTVYVNDEELFTMYSDDFNEITLSTNGALLRYETLSRILTEPYFSGSGIARCSVAGDFVLPNEGYYRSSGYFAYFHRTKYFNVSFSSFNVNYYGDSGRNVKITKPYNEVVAYQYAVANSKIGTGRRFKAEIENEEWTGSKSPVYFYTNGQNFGLDISENTEMLSDFTFECSSEYRVSTTDNGGATYRIGNDKPIPTTIGNCIVVNPETINDYEEYSTKDAHGKEKGDEGFEPETRTLCRNNILKMGIPYPHNKTRVNLLTVFDKVLCAKDDWIAVNCQINDLTGEITDIQDGAYLIQQFFREKYPEEKDPDGLLNNSWYRQRHWSHQRYMKSDFVELVEEQEQPFKADVELICHAYGDVDSHTWTAKYSDTIQGYDLIKCNGGGVGMTDEILSVLMPENYKLYNESAQRGDPEYGITYLEERPNTAVGWLPNIVGEVRINIPKNKSIFIGDLRSELQTGSDNAVVIQSGSEFKEMAYVGDHEPKSAEEYSDSFDSYESRKCAVLINGARCGDIPEYLKIRNPHRMITYHTVLTVGYGGVSLPEVDEEGNYTGDIDFTDSPTNLAPNIFPRDDIGELSYNIHEYELDEDDCYPRNAFMSDKYMYINWITGGHSDTENPNKAGYAIAKFDKFSSPHLGRFLRSSYDRRTGTFTGATIHLYDDYGANYNGCFIGEGSGVVREHSFFLNTTGETGGYKLIEDTDTHGAYSDLVDIDVEKTFRTHGKGTNPKTQWSLGTKASRTLEKVYDGMKYTLSYIPVKTGKILRNAIGKILRNSEGKILRGNDYDN